MNKRGNERTYDQNEAQKVCLETLSLSSRSHSASVFYTLGLRSNVSYKLRKKSCHELCGRYWAQGGRSLPRLIGGLWVSDDLPGGGGVAHVGGAPSAARPRQEAKAAAERVEKRQAWGQMCSRGLQLNIVQDWRKTVTASAEREMKPMFWFTDVCGVVITLALH